MPSQSTTYPRAAHVNHARRAVGADVGDALVRGGVAIVAQPADQARAAGDEALASLAHPILIHVEDVVVDEVRLGTPLLVKILE